MWSYGFSIPPSGTVVQSGVGARGRHAPCAVPLGHGPESHVKSRLQDRIIYSYDAARRHAIVVLAWPGGCPAESLGGRSIVKFTCHTCHEEHDLAELSFGTEAPYQWQMLSEEERQRSELTSDQCVIDTSEGRHFFVRACLDIPIRGTDRSFTWGVWVSLSATSFAEMSKDWTDPERITRGPFFGWLCTRLPTYPDSMSLKTMVHQRPVGLRPLVEVEATDHRLAVDQRLGIERADLEELVRRLLHGSSAE